MNATEAASALTNILHKEPAFLDRKEKKKDIQESRKGSAIVKTRHGQKKQPTAL